MSVKTDAIAIAIAIRMIDEEVVRLLNLSEEGLEAEVREGLRLIANLSQWREIIYEPNPILHRNR